MDLLISPKQKVNWRIDFIFFLDSLKQIYKSVKIQEIQNPQRAYIYKREVKDGNYSLEGALSKNLDCIIFNTNMLDKSLDFLKLCRICMPVDEDIVLYDEMYNNHLPLIFDVHKQQLDNIDDILNTF